MRAEEWEPDGRSLDPVSADVAFETNATVHARLHLGDRYPRTGCGGGLGEFWSGDTSEVTCAACLEGLRADLRLT